MKFFVESYGCAQNIALGRGVEEQLKGKGLFQAGSSGEADLVVVNTCTVKRVTETRMLHRIAWWRSKGKRLLITGCMATAQPGILLNFVNKDQIIPLESLKSWGVTQFTIEKDCRAEWSKKLPELPSTPIGGRAILPISRGCLGTCSYCIVRRAVGPLRSYEKGEVVSKAEAILRKGAHELYLTAQDCAVYGKDREGDLLDLLVSLSELKGNFRIRVGMMTPNRAIPIIHELLALMNKSEKLYRFLHLPVQSGDDKILKLMNRDYVSRDFKNLVKTGRASFHDLNVTTDLIVGFPCETEEAFQNSMNLILETSPNKVNLSKFADRPHTMASMLPLVPASVIDRRARAAHMTCKAVSTKLNCSLVGSEIEFNILKEVTGGYFGRTLNYLPVKIISSRRLELGETVIANVTSASSSGLTTNLS